LFRIWFLLGHFWGVLHDVPYRQHLCFPILSLWSMW
jgi:hypothetical protein